MKSVYILEGKRASGLEGGFSLVGALFVALN